eukprot:SM000153S01602  [mRNA]  locus=s153:108140:108609:- [translate_table: standard]
MPGRRPPRQSRGGGGHGGAAASREAKVKELKGLCRCDRPFRKQAALLPSITRMVAACDPSTERGSQAATMRVIDGSRAACLRNEPVELLDRWLGDLPHRRSQCHGAAGRAPSTPSKYAKAPYMQCSSTCMYPIPSSSLACAASAARTISGA